MKRNICLFAAIIMLLSCLTVPVAATEFSAEAIEVRSSRATSQYSFSIEAGKIKKASTSFSLAKGESVTISATYTPKSASVDFGLIDSEGIFHYLNVKTGNIDRAIEIEENGVYTFAVRNNSDSKISVTGQINY